MDTQTQIDRLIELAIVQRSELKALVEQLPQLREYLGSEIEKTFEQVEPQLRVELEEYCSRKAEESVETLKGDVSASINEVLKTLETAAAAKYSALMAERERNIDLEKQAEQKIAAAAAEIPSKVKEIVTAELARFPRAGEIDQLRKEFAEPRGLNPRGKWNAGDTYNKLDLVSFNGDSFVSNIDGNREKPNRSSNAWTLSAARGQGGGGGGITSLIDLYNKPDNGEVLIGNGTDFVPNTLTAGTGITITNGAGTITIDASAAQELLTATVKNAESITITRGQVVYLYGATGNMASVKLAANTSDATSAKTFGVVSDASIAPNGTGLITCVGVQSNLNLGAYNEGDTLYLGATAGSVTNVKPYAPNHLVYVGVVERANNGNGQLYVKIQNGYELDEIHDVQINAPRLAGQTLIYDATNSLWKNARLTAGVGVSISNSDSAITISADGGVNYQGTWNASTNTPTLTSSVGTKGFYYVVSVAGTTNLNGITDWQVGDWAIFNGSAWQKVDTTDQVTSVFGRQGAVTAVSTDYSSVGITNTAIGASNPSTGAFTTLSATGTLTVSSTGQSVIGGGSAGANTLLTLTPAANKWALRLTGSSTSGQSYGQTIQAGTTSADISFRVQDQTGSNNYFDVRGDGNITTYGAVTIGGVSTLNGQLNVQGNQITKFSDPAGNVGNNYGYIKSVATTSNTSTLTLGSCYGIATNVDAISIYNGNTTLAGNLTVSGGNATISKDQNAETNVYVLNNGGGTASASSMLVGSSLTGGNYGYITFMPTTFTTSSQYTAGSTLLEAGTAGPLHLSAKAAGKAIAFWQGNSNIAQFAPTSGNLLLGTTTDYAGRLQVASSGSDTALFYRATGRSRISINGISGSSEIGFGDGTTVNAASVWVAGRYNSDNSFRFAASNDLNTSVAMTLGTSGNVGIGTTSPNTKLSVAHVASSGTSIGVQHASNNAQLLSIGWNDSTDFTFINTSNGSRPLALQNTGGNLLVGTTTDAGQKLQVSGTAQINSDTTIGQYSSGSPVLFLKAQDSGKTTLKMRDGSDIYGFNLVYDGSTANLTLQRCPTTNQTYDVLTFSRTTGNATFAGNVNLNSSSGQAIVFHGSGQISGVSGDIIAKMTSGQGFYVNDSTNAAVMTILNTGATTFAGTVKATAFQISTDSQGQVLSSNANTLFLDGGAGDVVVRPKYGAGNFYIKNLGQLVLDTPKTPASASATGIAGTVCWDSSYIYVCTATNTWKRVAIATW